MSLDIEEQSNKKLLLDSLRFFPEELMKWCEYRGLHANIPTEWPSEGSIVITRGAKRVEIKMVDPDSCDSFMKLHRVWGLTLENAMGFKAFIARWPQSWRCWNRGKLGWEDVDFGVLMERELSEYFRVATSPAALSQLGGDVNARNHHATVQ